MHIWKKVDKWSDSFVSQDECGRKRGFNLKDKLATTTQTQERLWCHRDTQLGKCD